MNSITLENLLEVLNELTAMKLQQAQKELSL